MLIEILYTHTETSKHPTPEGASPTPQTRQAAPRLNKRSSRNNDPQARARQIPTCLQHHLNPDGYVECLRNWDHESHQTGGAWTGHWDQLYKCTLQKDKTSAPNQTNEYTWSQRTTDARHRPWIMVPSLAIKLWWPIWSTFCDDTNNIDRINRTRRIGASQQ